MSSCKLNFPVGILSKFCEEGDNFVDAIQLASYINSWQDWVDISVSFMAIQSSSYKNSNDKFCFNII